MALQIGWGEGSVALFLLRTSEAGLVAAVSLAGGMFYTGTEGR